MCQVSQMLPSCAILSLDGRRVSQPQQWRRRAAAHTRDPDPSARPHPRRPLIPCVPRVKVCRRLRDSSVGGAEAKLSVDAMALARHLYGAKESAKSAALKAEERRRNRMYDATNKGDDDAVSEVGSSSSMSSAYFDNVNLEEWIGVRDDTRIARRDCTVSCCCPAFAIWFVSCSPPPRALILH